MRLPYLNLLAAVTIIVASWACLVPHAFAGGGPENVAIVINEDSWASKAIANEYIALWEIPADNVIYLRDVPGFETINVDEFRERILVPVLETINERRLANQIDYICYSTDFPYAVRVKSDAGATELPQVITPTASINGLTYLYQPVLAKDISYLSLSANFYYHHAGPLRDTAPWTDAQQKDYLRAVELLGQRNLTEAETILEQITAGHPNFAPGWYNYACCLALAQRPEEAMHALKRAVDAGWADATHAAGDQDLQFLHERHDFKELLRAMGRERAWPAPESRGIRALYGWTPEGRRRDDGDGARYILSTMLAYTAGRGTSVAEAIQQLRLSRAADGSHPKGTFYFMRNPDVRSLTRQWAFAGAASALRALGHHAEIHDGYTVPRNRRDIVGLMAATANLKWEESGSAIIPGAICEHLTSTGGTMHERGAQSPLSVFLQAGAAGSCGTVAEPYAVQHKFPTAMMHVHYARGCSLAESFYQSIEGPYQLLIVGDPLCAPWASRPNVSVDGVGANETVRGTIELRPSVSGIADRAVKGFELFIDGRRVAAAPPGGTMRLDTTDLADGYHELRFVAVMNDPIETQGRAIVPILVSNRGRDAHLSINRPRASYGDMIEVEAGAVGAHSIDILHNGRTVATISGALGQTTVESDMLGMGRARLQAVARFGADPSERKNQVASAPIEIIIEPAPPLPAPPLPPSARETGLALHRNGPTIAVTDTTKRNWLRDAEIGRDDQFELEGWFHADRDDVYQLAVESARRAEVAVDGQRVMSIPGDGEWRYVPVSLAAGWHHFRMVCGAGGPRVDVRFGRAGTRSIGLEFRHERR